MGRAKTVTEKIFYDRKNKALVYTGRSATPEFWDKHWETDDFVNSVKQYNGFLSKITKRYLKGGSKVLEAGCGTGKNVYTLKRSGFRAFGVDYALQTVFLLHKCSPGFNIFPGDIKNLPFQNNYFDGCWSLGVIEHFFSGYQEIAKEMARVVCPGGYLFLTFPHMSPLRKLKVFLNRYPYLPDDFVLRHNEFYQFALDVEKTKKQFKLLGFEVLHSERLDGVKGLKDELLYLKPMLQRIYDSRWFLFRVVKKILDKLLKKWCGHSVLLVLRLKDER